MYFHGVLPVFSRAEDDLATFRMITAQFYRFRQSAMEQYFWWPAWRASASKISPQNRQLCRP